jgi:hypothetical protein
MKKITIKISLDPDMLEWVQQEAKKQRCSVSKIFRDFVLKDMKQSFNENKQSL